MAKRYGIKKIKPSHSKIRANRRKQLRPPRRGKLPSFLKLSKEAQDEDTPPGVYVAPIPADYLSGIGDEKFGELEQSHKSHNIEDLEPPRTTEPPELQDIQLSEYRSTEVDELDIRHPNTQEVSEIQLPERQAEQVYDVELPPQKAQEDIQQIEVNSPRAQEVEEVQYPGTIKATHEYEDQNIQHLRGTEPTEIQVPEQRSEGIAEIELPPIRAQEVEGLPTPDYQAHDIPWGEITQTRTITDIHDSEPLPLRLDDINVAPAEIPPHRDYPIEDINIAENLDNYAQSRLRTIRNEMIRWSMKQRFSSFGIM